MRIHIAALAPLFLITACMDGAQTAGPSSERSSRNITALSVGETVHLTVYLGETCGVVPSFADVEAQLPASRIVSFSDGGVGQRNSRRCGGATDGRVVLATGVATGAETQALQAGSISVVVN